MTRHDKSRFKLKFSINNIQLRAVFFAAVCLFLSVISGCQRQESSPYKLVDSGIWPSTTAIQKTFWLDNERILFVSKKSLSPDGGPDIMTIWNFKTGKIDFSHQLTSLICIKDRQVFFTAKDSATGEYKYYRGANR